MQLQAPPQLVSGANQKQSRRHLGLRNPGFFPYLQSTVSAYREDDFNQDLVSSERMQGRHRVSELPQSFLLALNICSIVYIHGISVPGGGRESEKWKTTIPDFAPPNSSLREFHLKTELGDAFNAEKFMRKSTELLNDVFTLHQGIKVCLRVCKHPSLAYGICN